MVWRVEAEILGRCKLERKTKLGKFVMLRVVNVDGRGAVVVCV